MEIKVEVLNEGEGDAVISSIAEIEASNITLELYSDSAVPLKSHSTATIDFRTESASRADVLEKWHQLVKNSDKLNYKVILHVGNKKLVAEGTYDDTRASH